MTARSRRKWWTWPRRWGKRRAPRYADNTALHAYEDAIVLMLLKQRGSGSVHGWCRDEPGRWHASTLYETFKRLQCNYPNVIGPARIQRYQRGAWHAFTYVTDEQLAEMGIYQLKKGKAA